MNVILPYRTAPNDALELRFALRSIQKYLTGYEDIYIIGDRFPSWLTGVQKITMHEENTKTARNILNKIRASFDYAGENVLAWQDDIFLQRQLDVKDIKYWYDGTLGQAIEQYHGNYQKMIINTALRVTESAMYFDIHAPIIYNKYWFERICEYDWDRRSYLIKSLYCEPRGTGTPMKDCKVMGPATRDEILRRITGNLFFSTGPQAIDPVMIEIFEELYPEASRYELPLK